MPYASKLENAVLFPRGYARPGRAHGPANALGVCTRAPLDFYTFSTSLRTTRSAVGARAAAGEGGARCIPIGPYACSLRVRTSIPGNPLRAPAETVPLAGHPDAGSKGHSATRRWFSFWPVGGEQSGASFQAHDNISLLPIVQSTSTMGRPPDR